MPHLKITTASNRRIETLVDTPGCNRVNLDVINRYGTAVSAADLTPADARKLGEALIANADLAKPTAVQALGAKPGDIVQLSGGPVLQIAYVVADQDDPDALRVETIAGYYPGQEDTWYDIDNVSVIGRAVAED